MSQEVPEEYAAGLTTCLTLADLRAHVGAFAKYAKDAGVVVEQMSEDDMREFRRGLKLERKGRFAGEEWAKKFAAVLMPEPMFTVAAIADRYKAPFMVTYRRLEEVRPDLLLAPTGETR